MTTIFAIGSLSLTAYGLMASLAMLLVLLGMAEYARRQGVSGERSLKVMIPALLMGWICGRLLFGLTTWFSPTNSLPSFGYVFVFWDGGYSLVGVLLGLLLGAWLGSRWAKVSSGVMLDGMALFLPLGIIVMRLAERNTGLGVGLSIEKGWPEMGILVSTDDGLMHAVWAYEIIAAVVTLVFVVLSFRSKGRKAGDAMLTFLLVFSAFQVLLESFRDDDHMRVHMQIHVQQVVCAFLLAPAMIAWARRAIRNNARAKGLVILGLLICVACIGGAILAEFGVDRWTNKVLVYGLMSGCLLCLTAITLWFRRLAGKGSHGA